MNVYALFYHCYIFNLDLHQQNGLEITHHDEITLRSFPSIFSLYRLEFSYYYGIVLIYQMRKIKKIEFVKGIDNLTGGIMCTRREQDGVLTVYICSVF